MIDNQTIDTLTALLLLPKQSGIYLSKPDIIQIGVHVGVSVPFRDRKDMLNDLFRLLRPEEIGIFFDNLLSYCDAKILFLQSIEGTYPHSGEIVSPIQEKVSKTRKKIVELHEEFVALA